MAEAKYTYWVDDPKRISADLKRRGKDLFTVPKAVCIPLSPGIEAGLIPPRAWREYEFCRRQFSWYDRSPFAGKTLIICDEDLGDLGLHAETIIRPRPDFQPSLFPAKEDLASLIQSPVYGTARPDRWEDISSESPEKQERWLKVMGMEGASFREIFDWHRANHANFLDPQYYTEENGLLVPYSIAPSRKVCSACLEFYNIVGREHAKKLVTPCPGAVLFGKLRRDVYYEVTRGAEG